jgi:putative hydrolase of HD superfamily
MTVDRLQQQLAFILELDKLKQVMRRSYLANGERLENSAEHSWHLALMALVLAEHANEPVNVGRVIKMVLIHDIVEIDAGDTFFYDDVGAQDKAEREQQAAERIFGLLPAGQGDELMALWQEFEARLTPDARFANTLDRLMPVLHNYYSRGKGWQENEVRPDQVLPRLAHMQDGSETLWQVAQDVIMDAIKQDYLTK